MAEQGSPASMPRAGSGDIPHLDDDVEIVATSDSGLVVRRAARTTRLDLVPDRVEAVLQEVDGRRDVATLETVLADSVAPSVVRDIIAALQGVALHIDRPGVCSALARSVGQGSAAPVVLERRVVVVGRGPLVGHIHSAFSAAGFRRADVIQTKTFASTASAAFRDRRRERTVWPPPSDTSNAGQDAGGVTVDELAERLEGADFVICSLEDAHYREILDVNESAVRAGVPLVCVAVGATEVLVGPMFVPGRTACFLCSELRRQGVSNAQAAPTVAALELMRTSALDPSRLLTTGGEATAELLREAHALLTGRIPGRLLNSVLRLDVTARGESRLVGPVLPVPTCPVCGDGRTAADASTATRLTASLGLHEALRGAQLGSTPAQVSEPVRTVGVLGGGTAGYGAALALRARFPHLRVSVVESSEIPIIGVGEATTPVILGFLHRDLGFDVVDFYAEVKPTWKIGIKFMWGAPGDYSFTYPFGYGKPLESLAYTGSIDSSSLEAMLMTSDRAPIMRRDGELVSLLGHVAFAYHLDNKRFVRYLQKQALRRGIEHIDATIADVEMSPDGTRVTALVAKDGRRLEFDLYIDCTGFRSRLLGDALQSPYRSYRDTLFTDTAVVANVPHGGHIKPYTLAEAMDNGWCWNIPQVEEDHRGYVFSSAHCSVEEAAAEMRAKNPAMGDYWTVRFRTGRHEDFWKGNVVAIGNSYGFVEPLESTAIHMIIFEIRELLRHFPASTRGEERFKDTVSRKVGRHWDYLRWFLGIHYRFNGKFDTPFWRDCRSSVDISGIQELVDAFTEGAPLHYRRGPQFASDLVADDLFGISGVDQLLLGQRVPAVLVAPTESRKEFGRRVETAAAELVAHALPQREALEAIRDNPELLLARPYPNRIRGVR